ncbi:MAG: type II toxin-antitoxin system Phd/YefM family antitoxin [Elusimicrobiota bacterium]|jgi:prevent-host-death family protein
MDKIIPISEFQVRAKKWVDQVRDTDQPVVITQRGKPAAVLVSCDDYEGMKATLDEMSYPDWKKRLARAEKESAAGKGISMDEYFRKRSAKQ